MADYLVCPDCSTVLVEGKYCSTCDDMVSNPKLSSGDPRSQNAWRVPRPEDVRGETHGDFTHMSITIQKIKDAMGSGEAWSQCSATQREALELIATKIGRIVCGDPNHVDHWDDIIGYATLARNRIVRAVAPAQTGERLTASAEDVRASLAQRARRNAYHTSGTED